VARIDALGHVNRRLAGIALDEADVPPGTPVESSPAGELLGAVTSCGVSPRHGGWLALAMLRAAAARPGTEVRVAGARARVVALEQAGEQA